MAIRSQINLGSDRFLSKTLLDVVEQFPDISIKVIVSTSDPVSGMTFTEQQFAERQQMIEYVKRQQYTDEEIRYHIYND